jgi:5-methylcytosine-specific restriction protein B
MDATTILHEAKNAGGTGSYGGLNTAVAKALGVDKNLVGTKSISAANQTSPRTGEFNTLRLRWSSRNDGSIPPQWVFVGLLTGTSTEYPAILGSLTSMLAGICSAGLILGSDPTWSPLRVYYARGNEDTAKKLQALFALPDAARIELPGPGWGASAPRAAVAEPIVRPVATPATPFSERDALAEVFLSENELQELLRRWRRKRNLILQGPPGVGKTFVAKRLAYTLLGEKNPDRIGSVQFHQSYSYEDFVQGWRPSEGEGFQIKPGLFYRFCRERADKEEGTFVFMIDEINRGNLAKIFGELLVLLESDKRGPSFAIPLVYSEDEDETFYVPDNVFVLGMMNTADRSLAMVDFALRRRFAFFELRPAFERPAFRSYLQSGQVAKELADKIVDNMLALNKEIREDTRNLGPGFEIGHSFFCNFPAQGVPDEAWYRSIILGEIAPLLAEYWLEDSSIAEAQIKKLLA